MTTGGVLVTGASSPIGEQLIEELLRDSRVGHVLAATDVNAPLSLPSHPRLSTTSVDFRKSRQIHRMIFHSTKGLAIDTIVHTSQVQSAFASGAKVHAHNVAGLRSIIEYSERHPSINRLVLRSGAEVYQVQRDLPVLISEEHPLNMNSGAPQWVRDRVEADITACTRMGLSSLEIVVLRMAEVLAPGCGSQLFDYLQSPVCMRPAGFDPMQNLLTIEDAAAAFLRAIHSTSQGVFNIPGADSLPLSELILRWGRLGLPLPELGMIWAYRLRQLRGAQFRYGMNRRRFHYSGVLDGRRAMEVLRYVPHHPIKWPVEVLD